MCYTFGKKCKAHFSNLRQALLSQFFFPDTWKMKKKILLQKFIIPMETLFTMVIPMLVPNLAMLSWIMPWMWLWSWAYGLKTMHVHTRYVILWKKISKFVVLLVYDFSHKLVHIKWLNSKGFQFLRLFYYQEVILLFLKMPTNDSWKE